MNDSLLIPVADFLNVIVIVARLGKGTEKCPVDFQGICPCVGSVIFDDQPLPVHINDRRIRYIHLPVIIVFDILCDRRSKIFPRSVRCGTPDLYKYFLCNIIQIPKPLFDNNQIRCLEIRNAHSVLSVERFRECVHRSLGTICPDRCNRAEPVPLRIRCFVYIFVNIHFPIGIPVLDRNLFPVADIVAITRKTASACVDIRRIALVILDSEMPVSACIMKPERVIPFLYDRSAVTVIPAQHLIAVVHPYRINRVIAGFIQPCPITCLDGTDHLESKDRIPLHFTGGSDIIPGTCFTKLEELFLDIQLNIVVQFITDGNRTAVTRKRRAVDCGEITLMTGIRLPTFRSPIIEELPPGRNSLFTHRTFPDIFLNIILNCPGCSVIIPSCRRQHFRTDPGQCTGRNFNFFIACMGVLILVDPSFIAVCPCLIQRKRHMGESRRVRNTAPVFRYLKTVGRSVHRSNHRIGFNPVIGVTQRSSVCAGILRITLRIAVLFHKVVFIVPDILIHAAGSGTGFTADEIFQFDMPLIGGIQTDRL